GCQCLEALTPGAGQVGDVGPFILDVLAERCEAVVRVERLGQGVRQAGFGHACSVRPRVAPVPPTSGGGGCPGSGASASNPAMSRPTESATFDGSGVAREELGQLPASALVPGA